MYTTALIYIGYMHTVLTGFHTGFFRSMRKKFVGHCHSVMHEYAAHTRVSVNASYGVWGHYPRNFFLDLRWNLRPGSDDFEKSSNSIIDDIMTGGS